MKRPFEVAASAPVENHLKRCVLPPGQDLWKDLLPAWIDLLGAAPASAFLSPTWMATWLDHFGSDVDAFGVAWEVDGAIVGAVVLGTGQGRFGPFRVSRAFLNASGRGAIPEHNEVLALPQHRSAVLDDLVSILRALSRDEVALIGASDHLFREVQSRWPVVGWNGYRSNSPYVDLEKVRAGGDGVLPFLSSNTRAQIRRSVRLYQDRFGPARLEVEDGPNLLEAFAALVSMHEEVWLARGAGGAFGIELRAFHEDLLKRVFTARRGLEAQIVTLRFGAVAVGRLYHLIFGGRVFFYQSGFNYHEDRRLKPGLVTHLYSIESCLDRGLSEYDFLGGEPSSVRYKSSLSTDSRHLWWAQLPAPSVKMKVLQFLRDGKQRLEREEEGRQV